MLCHFENRQLEPFFTQYICTFQKNVVTLQPQSLFHKGFCKEIDPENVVEHRTKASEVSTQWQTPVFLLRNNAAIR